jgi:hypothetical protein
MDELKTLLTHMGLTPVATAAIIIAAAIVTFLTKRALDHFAKQRAEQRERLRTYLREQEEALLKAYRRLYEGPNLLALSPHELVRLISQVDDLIMEPFTRHRSNLPNDVQAKIYNGFHSLLRQLTPKDPARPPKPEAVQALVDYRQQFLQQIESHKSVVNRHL